MIHFFVLVQPPSYLGCFPNNYQTDLLKNNGPYYTVTTCSRTAVENGHSLFGLRNGGECYTGNYYGLIKPNTGKIIIILLLNY